MKPTRGQLLITIFCLIPLSVMLFASMADMLSANPVQDLTLRTGRAAIVLLLLSLTCSPLNNFFHMSSALPMRKPLGLFAFLYAALHFLIFAGLDFEFNLTWILDELRQRLFLQIGLAALLFLIPLAITSTRRAQSRMGRIWRKLHRLAYPITALAIAHFYLASKGDILLPLIYSVIFLLLMLLRIPPLSTISISNPPRWLRELNRFLLL